jgi:hypothetical protein
MLLGALSGQSATFHGEIWQDVPLSAQDVSIVPDGQPDAVFDTSAINFDSSNNRYTIESFLNNPVFSNTSGNFDPTSTLDYTFLRFTGQIFLSAGLNSFEIAHDDGMILSFQGIGTVVNSPGENSAILTDIEVTAPSSGFYDMTLQYGECCGPPAALLFEPGADPPNLPDTASTWVLFGVAAAGLLSLRKAWLNQNETQSSVE